MGLWVIRGWKGNEGRGLRREGEEENVGVWRWEEEVREREVEEAIGDWWEWEEEDKWKQNDGMGPHKTSKKNTAPI